MADGHVHAPAIISRPLAPVIAEVYPHAAMVALFDLQKTIKYKQKWGVGQQRSGLSILRRYLSNLACAEPPLLHNEQLSRLLAKDLMALRGRALKEYEDTLDALVCAYIAYYFWWWLWDKSEVFGGCGRWLHSEPSTRRRRHYANCPGLKQALAESTPSTSRYREGPLWEGLCGRKLGQMERSSW